MFKMQAGVGHVGLMEKEMSTQIPPLAPQEESQHEPNSPDVPAKEGNTQSRTHRQDAQAH